MNDDKKCIVVLTGTFNEGGKETEEFKEYSQRSGVNVEANGGVVLSKYMVEENLGNGNTTPHIVAVVEYPSREKAIESFTNEEYKSLIPLGDVAYKAVSILITKQ